MATLTIPTDSGEQVQPQVLRCNFDGVPYQLTLRWNERAGLWRMDIADVSGNVLAAGLAVRSAGLPITTALYRREGLPPGLFVAVPTSDAGSDAGVEELGLRVVLTYVEQADAAASVGV